MKRNTTKVRTNLLNAMHEYMVEVNDEDIYNYWIMMDVPDKQRDCYFEFIAENYTMYRETVALFAKLV